MKIQIREVADKIVVIGPELLTAEAIPRKGDKLRYDFETGGVDGFWELEVVDVVWGIDSAYGPPSRLVPTLYCEKRRLIDKNTGAEKIE
jgi:hypothetical protein